MFNLKKSEQNTETPIHDNLQTEAEAENVSGIQEVDPALKEKLLARSKQLEALFGKSVGLLMRSPNHKHYSLSDLEWLILPALVTQQISLAQAKKQENGLSIPVGLAVWAKVSEEVDKRLSEALDKPIRLHPNEWNSGDIYWLVDVVGTPAVIKGLIGGLQQTAFKGKTFKMRVKGQDGQRMIKAVEPAVEN